MTREKIKYYLYSYQRTQELIDNSNKKILEYKEQIKIINSTFGSIGACVNDGMPHNPSPFTDKILLQIERKDREIENLKRLVYKESKKINDYLQAYNAISKVLQEAGDRTKEIVQKYYFENKTAIETCYLLGCSISTFKRENNALIEKLENEMEEQ